jgi:hypothetical protein
MEQTITIQPIINGKVNPRLTPELFAELPEEVQIRVIWNLKVDGEFAHSFQDIDKEVFVKIPTGSHEDHPDHVENFKRIQDRLARHHNSMRVKTQQRRFELGQRIHQAQRELGFEGFIQMDADRLQGFVQAGGNWNDFKVSDVNAGIRHIEARVPRKVYGVNNPNTGQTFHKWKIVPSTEYIVLEFPFLNKENFEDVWNFYHVEFQSASRGMRADSCRFEEQDLGDGFFSAELILWWD